MNLISIIGIVLIISVISITIKNYLPEYSTLTNILVSIFILTFIFNDFLPHFEKIKSIFSQTKIPYEYFTILMKSTGICILTQFASDACHDAGENSLANKIEWAGKISIIITSLPLFEKILQTALKLIGE